MSKRTASGSTEYRLLIVPKFDERRQITTTVFHLETAKYFASFRYELSVEVARSGNTIRFTILGLKAPDLSLPAAGHARFMQEFDGMKGIYEVIVEGLDGVVNTFSVRIAESSINILQSPPRTFVHLVTDPNAWPAD
jgi:hypothetical protein